jgi:AraC family transcriptional regulator of arabinose operon
MFDPTDINLVVLEAQYGVLSPSWKWDQVAGTRRSYLLWIVLRGKGTLRSNDEQFDLRRGECFLMDLNQSQRGRYQLNDTLHVPWFVFNCIDAEGAPCPLPVERLPHHFTMTDPDFVDSLVQRCVESKDTAGIDSQACRHWFRTILLELRQQSIRPAHAGLEQEQAERIEAMCKVIRDYPAGRWRVPDLARQMHCSTDHFIRVFRRLKGVTPAEFMIQSRLDAAREHLLFSAMSIAEIAETLGYRDQFFFSRQFRQRTGASPTAYRRSHTA